MANFTFNLRTSKPVNKRTPIRFIIRWAGETMYYPTLLSVEPRHWENDPKAKGYQRLIKYNAADLQKYFKGVDAPKEYNQKLKEMQDAAEAIFYAHPDERKITAQFLREELDIRLRRKERSDLTFYKFIAEYIEESRKRTNRKGSKLSDTTLRVYNQTYNVLKAFDPKEKLTFSKIDQRFYNSFLEFMRTEKNFSVNTMGKHIRNVKIFMNAALKDKEQISEPINEAFKASEFRGLSEEAQTIYLTEAEIADLEQLDLAQEPKLDNVRDLFIIGCRTGLRFSDLTRLSGDHIKEGRFVLTTKKTGEPVRIPMDSVVLSILAKRGGEMPKAISNQKTNEYLKEVCKRVKSLQVKEAITTRKQGVEVTTKVQKWELVSTHTARRSYCTNKYKQGVSVAAIRIISGHKTDEAFRAYIRVTDEEKIREIELSNKAPMKIA